MLKFRSLMAVLAAVAGLVLFTAQAQAQATRTWVSGVGDDANPCSRTAPCKTFAGAISKTAPAGEINVLDPGGFGAVTITKSISILSEMDAGVLVSGTEAIIVNVPNTTDNVVLRGLNINGMGTGLNGVKIINSGSVYVIDCSIRNFTQSGVLLAANANTRLVVENSKILFNGSGVSAQGISGAANVAFIKNSLFDGNINTALEVNTNSGIAIVGNSIISSTIALGTLVGGVPTALTAGNGGQIVSYGQNVIVGSGVVTTSLPLQ